MGFDSLALKRSIAIEQLITEKRYREALSIANKEVQRRPNDDRLLMQVGELLIRCEYQVQGIRLLRGLADRLTASGQTPKAVAVLKRLANLVPGETDVYEHMVAVLHDRAAQEPVEIPQGIDVGPAPPDDDVRVVEDEQVLERAVVTPLFEDFSRDELLAFVKGLQLQVYDPGDLVVMEGDPGDSLFIVTTGIVKAFVHREHAGAKRHHHVRTLHDGDFFGEISILQGGRRTATITAATHCELLELDRRALDSITAAHPRVREVMERFGAERLASDAAAV